MLGAIYGDKAGSIYEYEQVEEVHPIEPSTLITKDSFYTDDTILTMAIMDSILNNTSYEENIRKYILDNIDYKPDIQPYFKHPFSPNMINWAKGTKLGNSKGNGALMRISPVAHLFSSLGEVSINSQLATIPTHNTTEALEYAKKLAMMIFLFKKGYPVDEVFDMLKIEPVYKPFEKFNVTCSETFNNCMYAVKESRTFTGAIRRILSMGGDTDTNCAIVGSVAEPLFGMKDKQKDDAAKNLPNSYKKLLRKAYNI